MNRTLQDEVTSNNDRLWPEWRDVPHWYWVLCISGEAGELANKLKKIFRAEWGWRGKTAKFDDLVEELADIQIYLYLLAGKLSINLEKETQKKIGIVNDRFGWKIQEFPK